MAARLGLQSANLAVSDYSNDQSYLRLAAELPRFREPLAVVTLFMPSLFDCNLLDNRPQVAGHSWRLAAHDWRLTALLRWLIPYRSSAAVEEGIMRTRASLLALVDLTRKGCRAAHHRTAIRSGECDRKDAEAPHPR